MNLIKENFYSLDINIIAGNFSQKYVLKHSF